MNSKSNSDKQRSEQILKELLRAGFVSVNNLAERFEVTPNTIRRNLTELDQSGLLRRTHGGAVPVEIALYQAFSSSPDFREQEQKHVEAKRRIGLIAAELIKDGETIALTAGTTCTQVARSIRHRKNITIITNTVNIAMELSHHNDLNVIVTGGSLRGSWFSLVGPTAVAALNNIIVDKAFIGADGIHADYGITSHYPDEAAVNRAMAACAVQKIVVAYHDKIGKVANSVIALPKAVDIIITDSDASDELIAPLIAHGIEVLRA